MMARKHDFRHSVTDPSICHGVQYLLSPGNTDLAAETSVFGNAFTSAQGFGTEHLCVLKPLVCMVSIHILNLLSTCLDAVG